MHFHLCMPGLCTHILLKHRPPPKPVNLCHIPQMSFGRALDDSITTLIAFPELYRRDGSNSVGFPERKLLWERCIRPALMETHPQAVAALPRTLNRLKTDSGNRQTLLQNTCIPLDPHRQQFLNRFTELMATQNVFNGWFFIHIVTHDQAIHNPMDEDEREIAWTSLTEMLHVGENLNKWFIQAWVRIKAQNHVPRLKPEGRQALLQNLLPNLDEDCIRRLLNEHTSTSLSYNCFGHDQLKINCIQNSNVFATQTILLSPATSLYSQVRFMPSDLLPQNIEHTRTKIEALKKNLEKRSFVSRLFNSPTVDFIVPVEKSKTLFSSMNIIEEVFDMIPYVTMM
jgi:hypothetical protein